MIGIGLKTPNLKGYSKRSSIAIGIPTNEILTLKFVCADHDCLLRIIT